MAGAVSVFSWLLSLLEPDPEPLHWMPPHLRRAWTDAEVAAVALHMVKTARGT